MWYNSLIKSIKEISVVNTDLDRTDVVNLLKGIKPSYGGNVLTRFSGDQWNEDWEWDESLMADIPLKDLLELYRNIKKEKTTNGSI